MERSETGLKIRENIELAPYTTLCVGGPARFMAHIRHEEQIQEALSFARSRGCPLFVLGGGSNVLVSDSGFPGLVIRMEVRGIQQLDEHDAGLLSVAAGEDWDGFVERCVEDNLTGIECLSGIPGTVGGAPVQNIGAYGEEIGNVILSVRALDRKTESLVEISGKDCRFDYRSSIFNTTDKNRYIIIKVAFSLRPYGKPRIEYRDLQDHFGNRTRSPNSGEVRRAVIKIRESKGMILNRNHEGLKSAGSFFKNPMLDPEKASEIETILRSRALLDPEQNIPRFPAPEGKEKLPAAWFIEHAGFRKGFTSGNVGISDKHTLAIINRGGARTSELVDLMRRIRSKVYEDFGILLEPEPTFLGFDATFEELD